MSSSHLLRFRFSRPQAVFGPLHIVTTNDPENGFLGHLLTEIFGFPVARYQLEASSDLRAWEKVSDVEIENNLTTTKVELPQWQLNVTFRVAERQPR
jgi:hypothetical protein